MFDCYQITPSIYKNGVAFGEVIFFAKSLTSEKNFPIFVALLEKYHLKPFSNL